MIDRFFNYSKNLLIESCNATSSSFSSSRAIKRRSARSWKDLEIFVPKCKTIKINDLAKALDYKKPIKITGIRPGEKMHEYLLSEEETAEVYEYKSYYILKYLHTEYGQSNKSALFSEKSKKIKSFNYSSENNNRHLSIKEIKKIIPND